METRSKNVQLKKNWMLLATSRPTMYPLMFTIFTVVLWGNLYVLDRISWALHNVIIYPRFFFKRLAMFVINFLHKHTSYSMLLAFCFFLIFFAQHLRLHSSANFPSVTLRGPDGRIPAASLPRPTQHLARATSPCSQTASVWPPGWKSPSQGPGNPLKIRGGFCGQLENRSCPSSMMQEACSY